MASVTGIGIDITLSRAQDSLESAAYLMKVSHLHSTYWDSPQDGGMKVQGLHADYLTKGTHRAFFWFES